MTRYTKKDATPAVGELKVTPETSRIVPVLEKKTSEPINLEVESLTEEPIKAPVAPDAEVIQTDVKTKLAKKTDQEDVFVPSNPVALEKAATQVAKDEGFELNRGTSIGARLMARSRKLA
jgi:hypothetical protein